MKAKKISFIGLLFALSLCLSVIESLIPPIPFFPPGAKFGLSNIVVMYCIFFVGNGCATAIVILKSFFALITRGATASLLSLFGGLLSLAVIIILHFVFKKKISYLMLSLSGAIFHNIGQFLAFSLLFGSFFMAGYLIPLIFFGIFTGILSALLLKTFIPYIKNTIPFFIESSRE